ncbi:MAG: PfkB family carbohydrate kinase [Candidatus Gracilibacteria bacterium]|nr:PfkB family carbohydrate kinase [Candidatus Gracilibacteria bacterium]
MIQIFSNFANDIIVYENNRIISGGPALWISQALNDANVPYRLTLGDTPAIVQIDKDINGDDIGTIISAPIIRSSIAEKSSLLLISTLKDEFDLKVLLDISLPICIDIQGFLRGDNGKKKRFDCEIIRTKGEVYIKATREEFSYIDNCTNSGFTFIITDEGRDIEVLQGNNVYYIPIQSGKFKDTIGAGDIFFAIFCSNILEENTIKQSIQQASIYTYGFLKDKNLINL